MATTYTTLLKLAKPTQGELDGSWGTVVNDNITSMIEEAIAGRSVLILGLVIRPHFQQLTVLPLNLVRLCLVLLILVTN
jgi:hypothetical protein